MCGTKRQASCIRKRVYDLPSKSYFEVAFSYIHKFCGSLMRYLYY